MLDTLNCAVADLAAMRRNKHTEGPGVMKLTDAQYSALHTLAEFGPKTGTEVRMAPAMDGSRRIKLECHFLTAPTLARLEADGLVSVERGPLRRPTDAVGKSGHARRPITIAITDAGRAALGQQ